MNQLLSELRRRNVFRVAAAYLVVGWLVMQVVSVMTPALQLPGWVDGFFAVFLIALMPIALLMAWAFEMTPAGVKKTEAVDGAVEFRPLGGTDYVLIALMVLVLGVTGFQVTRGGETAPVTTAESVATAQDATTEIADIETRSAPTLAASIAVMPFADLSPDGDQQYFSDGISEELLNALAQFPDLRVAARTSAFSFRGELDLREVGEALGVAHVLEGSVRKSGERLRITAQLIRASDGFHLWSQNYDRTLTDVFEVQDEIVAELSRVLQFRLGVGVGGGRVAATDVDPNAYEHYLRGLSLWADRVDNDIRWEAMQSLRRATEIDPGFADAWASYGLTLVGSDFSSRGLTKRETNALGLEALNRALEIDPETARAHSGLATYYGHLELDMERALVHGRRAVELAPNSAHAHYFLGGVLFRAGDLDGALSAFDRTLTIDPLNEVPLFFLLQYLAENGLVAHANHRLPACRQCNDFHRVNVTRRVINHNGSEGEVRTALANWADWNRSTDDGTPEQLEEIEFGERFVTDITEVLLGVEGAGVFFSTELDNEFADTEDAAVLAHLGEDERAIDALFNSYQRWNSIAPGLEFILTPGRYEFPERTRRHPRYHEYWSLPGMVEWAEIRRANGQVAGLPLPIESDE
jgi:TolB-like protein